ncbi:hypothetical protein [Caballeronia sp. LZ034LL]|uniref:hypothetical protein n=1 Tax=Caballeronia sp. LZ034LL TaxID=3038567 RepID=UPI002857B199|nr:hypothetical protein [Caballeronia sp. LZ034LL]MDR5838788.1 hypothetical protein [Caballeronia sp. LZ034LL]
MNWRRLYATVQIWFMVILTSGATALFWAFVIAGIFRLALGIDEDRALLFIGGPLFLALLVWLIRSLPSTLRKVGMLSDDPKSFGPWLK